MSVMWLAYEQDTHQARRIEGVRNAFGGEGMRS